MNLLRIIIILSVAGVLGLVAYHGTDKYEGVLGEIHYHADIKIYLNGTEVNLSQEKYMTTVNNSLSSFVHLHDGKGNVVHKHATDVDLGYFFSTLNMTFNSTCFEIDGEKAYCDDAYHSIRMFVNGKENRLLDRYDFKDLDQILIIYDHEDVNINEKLKTVTDEACIYSEKCPERGPAPEEYSCLAGECLVE